VSSSDEESDEEDDDEALQRELEKIKAEREAANKRREEEDSKLQESELVSAAMKGNPLLAKSNAPSSATLKRRWNDDVVFRGQGSGEPELKKRFVNDTIRNDFHRQFISKFMK